MHFRKSSAIDCKVGDSSYFSALLSMVYWASLSALSTDLSPLFVSLNQSKNSLMLTFSKAVTRMESIFSLAGRSALLLADLLYAISTDFFSLLYG